ncbi:MAG: sulfotransferase [Planctomycetota bacterium]
MIIVSGCPRSGTSLMMDLFREALGEGRIHGEKFPQRRHLDAMTTRQDGEPARLAQARKYVFEKQHPDWKEEFEHSRKMNPNGFWEMRWTVQGIQWEPEPPAADSVCKIVSQGLARSNPDYIDKVVLMVRHPFSVAQSQQDLKRQVPFLRADGKPVKQDELRVLSPQMYINVSVAVSAWLDGPGRGAAVHRVGFDDLVSEPRATLEGVAAFVGEGDWERAIARINPKLRRSPRQPGEGEEWALAERIHARLAEGDWAGVVAIGRAEAERQQAGPPPHFFCPRWGGPVTPQQCGLCRSDAAVQKNMRDTAQRRRIDWRNEPCLWEVAYDPDRWDPDAHPGEPTPEGKRVYLTIERSIAANHWASDPPAWANDAPSQGTQSCDSDRASTNARPRGRTNSDGRRPPRGLSKLFSR